MPCPALPMQLVVGGLLSPEEDRSLLLSQFQEYLEHDDIRYHTMQAASDTVARVTDGRPEVSHPGPWEQGGRRQWACSIQVLTWPLAGAPHFLEQCLHAAVLCEPAPPGGHPLQLLCEAHR